MNKEQTLIAELESGCGTFARQPYLDVEGDCLVYLDQDVAFNADWINPHLTVFLGCRTNAIVGFKLKNIRHIVNEAAKSIEAAAGLLLRDIVKHLREAVQHNSSNGKRRPANEELQVLSVLERSSMASLPIGAYVQAA